MINEANYSFLKKTFTFWEHLSLEEQNFLKEHTATSSYKKGEAIHNGENDCIGILLVKSGCIRTYMLSETGKDVTLFRLYPNEVCVLSASCILQNITFEVHVDAEEDSELLVVDSGAFSKITTQNIYAENYSYKLLVDKFSDVMWTMEQILFMSFDKRLAIFLLDEASKRKSTTIPLTHEQIAKYIGSAREVVSRMLKYFANESLLELYRGGVILTNVPGLKKLVTK